MTSISFINAKIVRSYIISETTKCVKPFLSQQAVGGKFKEEGSLQVEWGVANGDALLTVRPTMICTVFAGEDVVHLRYECQSETAYTVSSFGGFDPEVELPEDATSPYVDMALWLTRSHAANAIREAGIPTFAFPNTIGAKQINDQSTGKSAGAVAAPVVKPAKKSAPRKRVAQPK